MDPSFMQQICGFRATSGNQVIRVVDLGIDGMTAGWQDKPSQQDLDELCALAHAKLGTKLGTKGWVYIHLAGQGEVALQRSREAYAAWKKSGRVR